MALQTANQFQLGTDFSQFGKGVQQGQQMAGQFQLGKQRDQAMTRQLEQDRINSVVQGASEIANIPSTEGKIAALYSRRERLQAEQKPTQDTDEALALYESGRAEEADALVQGVVNMGIQQGRLKAPGAISGLTSEQRNRTELINDVTPALNEDGSIDPSKLTAKSKSAAIDLGLIAKETITGAERIAQNKVLSEQVAESAKLKAEKTEEGKLGAQARLLPGIRADIKQAEKEAVARGETNVELISAKAAMPGLTKVVERLKVLSDDATFTLTGKAFNTIAKELGFSTKGGTSRAAMVSIVDNQVLPLLKPIFGAAFTAIEGDRLRNAFLDPDSTPDSRKAQVQSFLDQMQRNIQTKEAELKLSSPQNGIESTDSRGQGQIMVDANGNRARVFEDGTFEEL